MNVDLVQGRNVGATAAGFLARLGILLAFCVLPLLAIETRRSFVALLPAALALIVLSGTLRYAGLEGRGPLRALLTGLAVAPALALAALALASLVSAPDPAAGAERIFKVGGSMLLGVLAALAVSRPPRAASLYLLAGGVGLGLLAVLATALSGYREPMGDPRLERVAIFLLLVAPVGAGWLVLRGYSAFAAALVALALLAGLSVGGPAVAGVLAALAVGGVLGVPAGPAGKALRAIVCALIVLAPAMLLPALAAAAPHLLQPGLSAFAAALWSNPAAFAFGHGAGANLVTGAGAPGMLPEIAYDLGFFAAIAAGLIAASAAAALSRLDWPRRIPATASLVALLWFAAADSDSLNLWWPNVAAAVGLAIALVAMSRRARRPVVRLRDTADGLSPGRPLG